MIVPFGMIPSQYLLPLNVETKMEYTINKRKFPGLKDKSKALHPALLIATLSEKDESPGNSQESPIDLSKSSQRKQTVCCTNNNTESRQRQCLRRALSRVSPASRLQPRHTGITGPTLPAVSTQTDMNRSPGGVVADVKVIRKSYGHAAQSETRTQTTRIATHPSYLDFIYGEKGILATNSYQGKQEGKSPVATAGKRKRGSTEDEITGNTNDRVSKKCKVSNDSPQQSSNSHTIHYMPTAASVLCGKPSKDNSSLFYTNVQQLWPSVVSLGTYNDQIITTSRRTCGRQS